MTRHMNGDEADRVLQGVGFFQAAMLEISCLNFPPKLAPVML